MASSNQRYQQVPPIPSYDEAIAGGSRPAEPSSPAGDAEAHSLLHTGSRSRPGRSGRYRSPTVESEDESLWDTESDEDDAAFVRREMQELEVEDPSDSLRSSRSSIFGKGFSLSLPRWKWSWRWRVPRFRIQLPDGPPPPESSEEAPRRRFACPSADPRIMFLIFARLLALFFVLGFLYLIFMSDIFSSMSRRIGGATFDPESVRGHIQAMVDRQRIRDHLKAFTAYSHLAGTEGDFLLAEMTRDLFVDYGLEQVQVDEYYTYLNYPTKDGRAVEILGDDGKATWSAKLEEDDHGQDVRGHETYAFHGLSKAGDVKGPLIYANYGSRDDFKRLHDTGIDTKGAIALVRNGGTQTDRALKIKAAEMAGFAGCILYNDPKDDGFLKGEPVPHGGHMSADSVQRGSVSLMSWVVGDVLTPGWESKKGMPRLKPEEAKGLVQIPSIPMAWREVQVLLQKLRGKGTRVPREWEGGVPEVEYWTGNDKSPVVRLKNEQDEVEKQPVWNVYGKIVGLEQSEKSVIIGNHRDAWTSGATDPHSGTAVFLEMVRIFGDLLARGWRPLRTIEFMSWDAEEYNLIGSTEYVEKNSEWLIEDGLAYINLDTAVTGSEFHAAGSPVFRKLLLQVLKRVYDPLTNETIRHAWDLRRAELEALGAGSDYVAFQDLAGISSLDLFFSGDAYPLHTGYDTFDWMERTGDPNFTYHTILGQIVGLLIIELCDRPILPFDLSAYGQTIKGITNDLVSWATGKGALKDGHAKVNLNALTAAADTVDRAVVNFEKWESKWQTDVLAGSGWEPMSLGNQRVDYNSRMARFESNLLDLEVGGGVRISPSVILTVQMTKMAWQIPNRTQFKHVLFGPDLWSSYDAAFFPAIRDSIEAGDWDLTSKVVDTAAKVLQSAADGLKADEK
jgi:N-acetylated-alpha-linked acidic dipeptidase